MPAFQWSGDDTGTVFPHRQINHGALPPQIARWLNPDGAHTGSGFARQSNPDHPIRRKLDAVRLARHNCGVTAEPIRTVRDHLSEIVDRVEREHDRVVITRNGREAAVLLSAADLA